MNPTARSKTPARRARATRRIEVAVTSPLDADLGGRDWFSTPTAAASFAVVKATTSAEFRGVDQVMVTMTYDNGDDSGLVDVCVAGTPGEITCALAAMPVYAAGVRKALVPSPEYVHIAVGEVADPIQGRLLDEDAMIDVRVHSIRPDPLPNSQYSLSRFAQPVARELAHDLARAITAHSDGGRSQATVAYLAEQDRIVIEHHVEISATDSAAVKRYTRITQLRASLAVLDPAADAETAAQLGAELQTLGAPMQRTPAQSATPGCGTTELATLPTGVERHMNPVRALTASASAGRSEPDDALLQWAVLIAKAAALGRLDTESDTAASRVSIRTDPGSADPASTDRRVR